MFNDRSKNYDFNKLDQNARTQVILKKQEQSQDLTDAQKTLFATTQTNPKQDNRALFSKALNSDTSSLASTKYLQSFDKNMTVEQAQELIEEQEPKQEEQTTISTPKIESQPKQSIQEESVVDFDHLIEEASSVKIDEKLIKSELSSSAPAPKKNYSFRIKLVAGVYCILVALFGGWVIGNAIDIAQTNASLYETLASNQEISAEIGKIVLKIKNFDSASKNPEDGGILTEMATEVIDVIPEEIIQPNEYVVESNWFDVLCNWIGNLFGVHR